MFFFLNLSINRFYTFFSFSDGKAIYESNVNSQPGALPPLRDLDISAVNRLIYSAEDSRVPINHGYQKGPTRSGDRPL